MRISQIRMQNQLLQTLALIILKQILLLVPMELTFMGMVLDCLTIPQVIRFLQQLQHTILGYIWHFLIQIIPALDIFINKLGAWLEVTDGEKQLVLSEKDWQQAELQLGRPLLVSIIELVTWSEPPI